VEEAVNKAQLINTLSDRLGGRRAANEAVESILDTVVRTVSKGERVALTGFGIFEKVERKARSARNPATGEKVRVKKTSVPKFKAGQGFKDVVSGAKKLPRQPAATKSTDGTTSAGRKTTSSSGGPGTAKKTAAKKTAAKKTAAKKTAAKKTAAKRTATKKSTASKTAATKTAAKKSTATKTTRAAGGRATPGRKTSSGTTTRRAAKKS
jgi:DNA-binding protein HU-beta